jgi:hypothetical protein
VNNGRQIDRWAWRLVVILSIIQAGAYVGKETAAHYFWDLTSYVEALDSDFPYRAQRTFPFLYPPFAADLFTALRSHMFELVSIAYVAALVYFLVAFAQLTMPRRFEWLLAITAMGGLGIVSLQSGNVAIVMNLTVLGLALQAAMGQAWARRVLPIAIGFGALIKPQFIVYLGLLPCVEQSWKASLTKMAAIVAAVAAVYAGYMVLRPFDWSEYVQAITKRAVEEKDFAWGPAGFIKRWSDSNGAALTAYVAGLAAVAALALSAWRRSARMPAVALVSLAFVVLTFANPRLPLYDVYAAAIAIAVCCALSTPAMAWTLAAALGINVIPWAITEFARAPSDWPSWMQDLQIAHMAGIGGLLIMLAIEGVRPAAEPNRTEIVL